MSRAFVKENDQAGAIPLPDRPISPHRNLVTRRGLRQIETKIGEFEGDLARATAAADREGIGRASRELRYWTARLATAEVTDSASEGDERVVFGVAVTVRREDGSCARLRIVGEDEADPAQGRIGWTAPVAKTLLGSMIGDLRALPMGEVEIVAIDATPEGANE
jgi:transcription elongation GreA/GreB family factor